MRSHSGISEESHPGGPSSTHVDPLRSRKEWRIFFYRILCKVSSNGWTRAHVEDGLLAPHCWGILGEPLKVSIIMIYLWAKMWAELHWSPINRWRNCGQARNTEKRCTTSFRFLSFSTISTFLQKSGSFWPSDDKRIKHEKMQQSCVGVYM